MNLLLTAIQRDLLDELFLLKSSATSRASFDSPTEAPKRIAGRGGFFAGGASSQHLGGPAPSQLSTPAGGPKLIVGNEPPSLDLHVGANRRGLSGTLTRRRKRRADR